MVGSTNNGGRRINKLEKSDAVQDTKLDTLVKDVGEVRDMLKLALPQIIRNEERISASRAWITRLWTLGVALLLLGAKAAFFN